VNDKNCENNFHEQQKEEEEKKVKKAKMRKNCEKLIARKNKLFQELCL
jgi:hypothetical protein